MIYSVVVMGAGVAGLTAAKALSDAGRTVLVVEKNGHCGGAHKSRNIGPYTFDVGSVFFEKSSQVFGLAADLKADCSMVQRQQMRINQDGSLAKYPIRPAELRAWSKITAARAVLEMVAYRISTRRNGTLERICLKRLGPTFFERTGLKNYITRFHHIPPSKLDEAFFDKRMNFITHSTRWSALFGSLLKLLAPRPQKEKPRPFLFVRPRNGFDAMYGPIRAQLEARGAIFKMDCEVTELKRDGDLYELKTSKGSFLARTVVNTTPLETIYNAAYGRSSGLKSLDLLTLYVSAEYLDEASGNVLFNFHTDGLWKRITVYSRIYPEASTGRAFFSVELTQPLDRSVAVDDAFADLRAHLEGLGIARGLKLEGHDIVEAAYPVYAFGFEENLNARMAEVSALGIVSVGRQGRFEYLPTADGVIRRVVEELEAEFCRRSLG